MTTAGLSKSRGSSIGAAAVAIKSSISAALESEKAQARLEQAAIAYGRVSDLEDLSQHPQNRYVEVETPTGPVRMLAPGALVDGASPEFGPVPACGAHTAAVLREFGG